MSNSLQTNWPQVIKIFDNVKVLGLNQIAQSETHLTYQLTLLSRCCNYFECLAILNEVTASLCGLKSISQKNPVSFPTEILKKFREKIQHA